MVHRPSLIWPRRGPYTSELGQSPSIGGLWNGPFSPGSRICTGRSLLPSSGPDVNPGEHIELQVVRQSSASVVQGLQDRLFDDEDSHGGRT